MGFSMSEALRSSLALVLRLVPFGLFFICIVVCDTPVLAVDCASYHQLYRSLMGIAKLNELSQI